MIHFEGSLDIRTRQVTPQVATLRGYTGNPKSFIVIGTDYGHIHTSGGDIRTWKSYSGARKFLNSYLLNA